MVFSNDFVGGFVTMVFIVGVLNSVIILASGQVLLATLFFLILPVLAFVIYERIILRNNLNKEVDVTKKTKHILVFLQGIAFACWVYDVSTTYLAIDILHVAVEKNPMGWPFGALGALIYYMPAFIFTYFLLFRTRPKYSILVAAFITFLTLYVGSMNLVAGEGNALLVITWVTLPPVTILLYLFATILAADVACLIGFAKSVKLKFKPSVCRIAVVVSSLALIISIAQPAYIFIENFSFRGQPSFELSQFCVAYTYTYLEIHNNGSATAFNVVVDFCFLRSLNSSSTSKSPEWAVRTLIAEIRKDESRILTMPIGRYHVESTFPNMSIEDFEARVSVICVADQSEIHAIFELDHFTILPVPET